MSRKRAIYVGRQAHTPETTCLNCGKLLDGATGVGHRKKPRPGSITVCMYCGHIQAFGAGLKMRALTDKEMADIAGDPVVLAIQKTRAMAMKGKPNG